MTVTRVTKVDTPDNGYNGQVVLARGVAVLNGAGNFLESVPNLPSGTTAIATWDTSTAGPGGQLVAGYDAATGMLQVISTAGAADAGEIANWLLVG